MIAKLPNEIFWCPFVDFKIYSMGQDKWTQTKWWPSIEINCTQYIRWVLCKTDQSFGSDKKDSDSKDIIKVIKDIIKTLLRLNQVNLVSFIWSHVAMHQNIFYWIIVFVKCSMPNVHVDVSPLSKILGHPYIWRPAQFPYPKNF